MSIAALIIGIDGWDRYTKPLVESIRQYESEVTTVVIDNASAPPYPYGQGYHSFQRLSYSQAINLAKFYAAPHDWYIVLSNDVLCTGPFAYMLRDQRPCVAGPQLWQEHGLSWIVGWCVCLHRTVWDAIGGWDEGYVISSYEDVDVSVTAIERGYPLLHLPAFPFIHLDQRQRFTLPGYEGSESHNAAYFAKKHTAVTA
jgi:hypothetical protein